ncbi:MAG: AFG1 family ATPase [Alphaproteobacteria bacterium]|nr:AFG1 family ATPase [Alphaproteobacteria bacterium]
MNDNSANTPLQAYRALRTAGELRADPAQELAAEKLQTLHRRLERYDPTRGPGWQELLRLRRREPPPEGLYIYGDVGRGKSMLMDLFFATAPVTRKRRAHFHAFMAEVHERLNRFRHTAEAERQGNDPIPAVARELAETAWLLFFDEFEVRDIADAMLVGRLFEQLFQLGVVVVATSNRAPDQLYEGGLNRQLFLPFIQQLKQQLDVLHLDGQLDHRMLLFRTLPVYHVPADEAAETALRRTFRGLTDRERGEPAELTVKGRILRVPEAAAGVARFGFAELCEQPLGALDYLALAQAFHTLIVSGIPVLGPESRNAARRLVLLIDVLYDHRLRFICSAAAPPAALYAQGEGAFEFQRTASRLTEMQTSDYLETCRARAAQLGRESRRA